MSPAAPCPDLPAWRWGPPPGEGRAVVLLLHGLGHDAETVWRMLGPGLPADVSVLAPEGQFLGRDGAGHAWFSVTLGSQGPQANLAEEAQSRGRVIPLAFEGAQKAPPWPSHGGEPHATSRGFSPAARR
jgi:predicted esterase